MARRTRPHLPLEGQASAQTSVFDTPPAAIGNPSFDFIRAKKRNMIGFMLYCRAQAPRPSSPIFCTRPVPCTRPLVDRTSPLVDCSRRAPRRTATIPWLALAATVWLAGACSRNDKEQQRPAGTSTSTPKAASTSTPKAASTSRARSKTIASAKADASALPSDGSPCARYVAAACKLCGSKGKDCAEAKKRYAACVAKGTCVDSICTRGLVSFRSEKPADLRAMLCPDASP